jgi:geranylgeranyl diphosphate synthase type II
VARTDTLVRFIEDARERVDSALESFLPRPPECPALLSAAIRYSIFAGGKRLRPILVLAAADAVDRRDRDRQALAPTAAGSESLAMPAACAVEYIHTYSLIHDDLPAMDNDTLRRGRPTLHVVYGDGIAILAGDALQAQAFALIAREPSTADPVIAARKLMTATVIAEAAGAVGMVGGQAIDLQAAGQVPGHGLTLDADTLRGMHARKTGALIRASAVAGAVMAGADSTSIGAVDRWAADIGLAFQIVDDILDIEGSAAELGKTAGKDAAGEKPTYPAVFGLDRARSMATECAERARHVLSEARLTEGWLDAIADWVLTRKN